LGIFAYGCLLSTCGKICSLITLPQTLVPKKGPLVAVKICHYSSVLHAFRWKLCKCQQESQANWNKAPYQINSALDCFWRRG